MNRIGSRNGLTFLTGGKNVWGQIRLKIVVLTLIGTKAPNGVFDIKPVRLIDHTKIGVYLTFSTIDCTFILVRP